MERRLSAILVADMVGFSRLMETDEVGTLHRQMVHRAELIDPSFEEFHGRVFKEMGDGILVEFPSVVEAVQCAVDIQQHMVDREANVSSEKRIRYRIGINLGDVIIEGDDIFGDGVNVAARLEQLAEPGGICISGTIFDHLKSKIEVGYESLGAVQVKNIAHAVRAYRVLTHPDQVGTVIHKETKTRATGFRMAVVAAALIIATIASGWWWWQTQPADISGDVAKTGDTELVKDNPTVPVKNTLLFPEKPSIAVLPFDNLSNDPEQEYFSDGITEDLITDLSQVSGLFVIARNTVFTYKGQAQDIQKIGNKLGVKYVLEGSVRKAGNTLRINAQLIDVQTGGHIWAQRFDRRLADVFELQDDVVRRIVAALAITLNPVEKERLERVKKVHPDAYILFLRGLELMRRFTKETNIQAAQFFEKSIATDPNFTRAYAGLAFIRAIDADFFWTDDPDASTKLALELAQKALKLDNSVPQTYFALTAIYRNMNLLTDGISAARKAIALDPNYADAYANLAINLNYAGELDEALKSIDYAMRLNPESSFSYRWIKGHTHYLLGQLETAAKWLEDVRYSNPEFSHVYNLLIVTYVELGQIEEAEWAASELLTLIPDFSIAQERDRAVYRDEGLRRRYLDGLRKAGIE